VRGFLFSGYSLRLRKPKQKASANSRVKNHRRPLFRVYNGPGEIHSTLRPNPLRNSNSKAKRPFLERLTHAQRPPRESPVALTPRQGKRRLWQAKRALFHLRHDDRVKKGVPHHLNSYPFPPPLSLSCYRDRVRGYSERDPSPRRKRAPSPPTDLGFEGWHLGRVRQPRPEHSGFMLITDQGFEGWPLGRVRQPPQSTQAPRPLLIRGLKAGPSEGFDSLPRARRARDDSGYVRYMAEARATLSRYPRTFPRPAGVIL
jgi:hypothetical protein